MSAASEDRRRTASAGDIVLVVNTLVIAEIVWTLESTYGLAREGIKDKLLAIGDKYEAMISADKAADAKYR